VAHVPLPSVLRSSLGMRERKLPPFRSVAHYVRATADAPATAAIIAAKREPKLRLANRDS